MSSPALARLARAAALRPVARLHHAPVARLHHAPVARPLRRFAPAAATFATSARKSAEAAGDHDPHHEESFEEFTARYEKEFDQVQDVFELQRNLNNAFAYDLVPSTSVITAALRAARRVNDYPTAVRIFEGIKAKVENHGQYDEYIKELQPLREELGVNLKESMYPEGVERSATEST